MATTVIESFKSRPEDTRAGITAALQARVPEFAHLLQWNSDGITASGSTMGARGTLALEGEGPTTMTISFSIGFPASLKYSEADAERALREAIKELKSRVR
jgi:hypothetical protein